MHPTVEKLKTLYESQADPQQAEPMAAYMRNQFEYLGIKTPQSQQLLRSFLKLEGLPPLAELESIVRDLWALPQREFQYLAIGLVGKWEKKLPPEFIETLEFMLVTKSWWDTVDTISSNVGVHFKRHPAVRAEKLAIWRKSDNFWLRRVTLLFQLHYKNTTDFELMKALIYENLGSKEFFINKAIGWALRQYSRVDEKAVREFVAQTPLHPLSAREAVKWLENKKSAKIF